MKTTDFFLTMTRYNRWMNERLYAVCAEIPDPERKRDMGAFFRSIHGTLNHLLLADRLWMGRFLDRPFAIRSLDQELYADFSTLRAEREKTDREIEGWIEGLTEEKIAAPFTFTTFVRPRAYTFPLGFVLMHLFNHQTHHRGQLTTLLNQAGYDSGVTDLLLLPEPGPDTTERSNRK